MKTATKRTNMARTTTKDINKEPTIISNERSVNGFVLKSVPLPEGSGRGPGGGTKWPLSQMLPGECFEVEGSSAANSIRTSISKLRARQPHVAFAVRQLRKNEVTAADGTKTVTPVFGVWRLEDVTTK